MAFTRDLLKVLSNKSVNLTLALLSSSPCLQCPAYASSCLILSNFGTQLFLAQRLPRWLQALSVLLPYLYHRGSEPGLDLAGLEPVLVWALQRVEGQALLQGKAGRSLQP